MTNRGHIRHHPLYDTWRDMKRRCYDPRCPQYPHYGGRGIKVCARWLYVFENFRDDMGERPPGTTLDRKENDKGYSKENCRWATHAEQNSNRRKRSCHVNQLKLKAREAGISYGTAWYRINVKGWPEDLALALPVASRGHHFAEALSRRAPSLTHPTPRLEAA